MIDGEKARRAVALLHSKIELSPEETGLLFSQATSVAYWRGLIPGLRIGSAEHRVGENTAPTKEQGEHAAFALQRHGYFHLDSVFDVGTLKPMRAAVEEIRAAGWPAVFSFLYDEFWGLFRDHRIVDFLELQLGKDYGQLGPIWTYYVDPQKNGSGWGPHVDSAVNGRLTLWVPLSNASIENGCMYVVARDKIPKELPLDFRDWRSISREQLSALLREVTPLPATAGDLLGWNHFLLHWGGSSRNARSEPRVSIAVEFIAKDAKRGKKESTLHNLALPEFATRLRLVGESIMAYDRFEPAVRRFFPLAQRLIEFAAVAE